jgi:two-component system chemotaxis response regulator CheB
MRLRPMPVVMVSSLTAAGSDFAIQALHLGAVDCVAKPGADRPHFPEDLAERVYQAAQVQHPARRGKAAAPAQPSKVRFNWNGRILLIGASTGGVEAIERVLTAFPADCPPTLITQHMPEGFLRSFATRLNGVVHPQVTLAAHRQPLSQGCIYLAPGGAYHLELGADSGAGQSCRLIEGEKYSGHRPSVDKLFHSATSIASDVTALLLTGMGRDGAEGMLALRQAGAYTIAQDELSCVVYGMPRVAVSMNAAVETLSLDSIAGRALSTCSSIAKAG